jgi:lactate permease
MGIIFGQIWWWILAVIWPIAFFGIMAMTSKKAVA